VIPQEVSDRLESDRYGWLTTVAKSGQPVPRLVGFLFDGNELTVYSMPNAAKIAHIEANPRVSLNLESDGRGSGVIVVGGEARVDAVDANPMADKDYVAKYGEYAKSMGMSDEFLSRFNTRLKISIDKVWMVI
jgi:PPOX class probable F420-dependent enzyme